MKVKDLFEDTPSPRKKKVAKKSKGALLKNIMKRYDRTLRELAK